MGQNKSFYLAADVVEYLGQRENASAEVNRLIRAQIARDAEAAAFERAHGTPLTEDRRARARQWAREQLADAAARAEAGQASRDELLQQLDSAA